MAKARKSVMSRQAKWNAVKNKHLNGNLSILGLLGAAQEHLEWLEEKQNRLGDELNDARKFIAEARRKARRAEVTPLRD